MWRIVAARSLTHRRMLRKRTWMPKSDAARDLAFLSPYKNEFFVKCLADTDNHVFARG
jgi:hypothetical protein